MWIILSGRIYCTCCWRTALDIVKVSPLFYEKSDDEIKLYWNTYNPDWNAVVCDDCWEVMEKLYGERVAERDTWFTEEEKAQQADFRLIWYKNE